MKKILFILFFILSSNVFATEVEMNFTKDTFESAQRSGKIVVVNSWNKWCYTCVKQEKIIKEAKKDFEDILFFNIEHVKNKNLVKDLNINFWSTIAIYKNNKQIAHAVGLINKDQIYSLIKKGI